MTKTRIYFDNAATTKISDRVFEKMLPFLKESYGNPSSLYSLGREASAALNNARSRCAELLCCKPAEIYFTSGGSESVNWAIRAAAEAMRQQGKNHIVTSVFEHHAVLNTVKELEQKGFNVTYLPVYENGIVKAEDAERAITDKTALVTVMYVNNEIGTIQPIPEIGEICRKKGAIFHTDAVQAAPHIKITPQKANIDLLSISGHKLHAPKGVGLLYCRKSLPLTPYITGGNQERGLRAGTENLASIAGLAEAMTETAERIDTDSGAMLSLSQRIINSVEKIQGVYFNGDKTNRIPSILNYSFEGIEGESLVLQLDLKGIACSSGSACTSGSIEPSHVLLSLGQSEELAKGSLRISLSRYNTAEETEYFAEVLTDIIGKLRAMRNG